MKASIIRAATKAVLVGMILGTALIPASAQAACVGRSVSDDKGNAAGAGACASASAGGVSVGHGATVDSSDAATRVEYFGGADGGTKMYVFFCYGINYGVECPVPSICATC